MIKITKHNKRYNKIFNDRKGIDGYVKKQIQYLQRLNKTSRIIWNILTICIGILNLTIVVISIYILQRILNEHPNPTFKDFGPTTFMCAITISLFLLGFAIAINTNLKQDYRFKKTIDIIQNEIMLFHSKEYPYNEVEAKKILQENIKINIKKIFSHNKKLSWKKIFLFALVGNKNE